MGRDGYAFFWAFYRIGVVLTSVFCRTAAVPFPCEEDEEQLQCRHPQEALHEQDQQTPDFNAPSRQVHGRKGL
jgi:hypothetical protein